MIVFKMSRMAKNKAKKLQHWRIWCRKPSGLCRIQVVPQYMR